MCTAWAHNGHGIYASCARQVTDAAMLLESDGQGGLVLSSLPLSTTESGPHAARSRPSARCNHTATILGDALYVYGGAAGSWEFDDVCRIELRALRGAQRVLQWELLEARPPRASSLPLPRQHHVAMALDGHGLLVLGGSCGERVLGEALLLRPDDATQAQAQPNTPTRTDSPQPQQPQPQQQPQQQ